MSFPNNAQQILDEAVVIANETIDKMLQDVERPSRCSTIDEFVALDEFVYEVAEHIETTDTPLRATELAQWMLEEFYRDETAEYEDEMRAADEKFDGGEFSRSRR